MRTLFSIFLIIQLAPCWGQLYFNNVYEEEDVPAEFTAILELDNNGNYILPSWHYDSLLNLHFDIRKIGTYGNDAGEFPIDTFSNPLSGFFQSNFTKTSDGGYIYAGMLDTACIVKITADLQLEWRTNVGVFLGSMESVTELANGQFFCTWIYLAGQEEGMGLYWFNADGTLANYVFYLIDGAATYIVNSVNQLSNGDLLITLWMDEYLSDDPPIRYFDNIIARLNSETGAVIWQERLSHGNFNKQLGWMQAIVENENEATVAFMTKDSLVDIFNAYGEYYGRTGTLKLDLNNGDTSDVVLLDELMHFNWTYDFEKTLDGGYVFLMFETNSNYWYDKYILKIDSSRHLEWKKAYNPLPEEQMYGIYCEAWDIDICPDSGFVVSGWAQDTNSEPTFHNGKQIPWVFKTDYCGELEWNNCGADNIAESHADLVSASVFPNPASDKITVSSTQEFESITIRDITGKPVYSSTMSNHLLQTQLDISSLANGLYLIEVDFGEGRVGAQKLVVE
jgi:hypothetical protein